MGTWLFWHIKGCNLVNPAPSNPRLELWINGLCLCSLSSLSFHATGTAASLHLFESLFSGLFPGSLLLGARSPWNHAQIPPVPRCSCRVPPAWIRLFSPVGTNWTNAHVRTGKNYIPKNVWHKILWIMQWVGRRNGQITFIIKDKCDSAEKWKHSEFGRPFFFQKAFIQ